MVIPVVEVHIAVALSVVALLASLIALMFGVFYILRERFIMKELRETLKKR